MRPSRFLAGELGLLILTNGLPKKVRAESAVGGFRTGKHLPTDRAARLMQGSEG
jgi:hypothetical protein